MADNMSAHDTVGIVRADGASHQRPEVHGQFRGSCANPLGSLPADVLDFRAPTGRAVVRGLSSDVHTLDVSGFQSA
jgi:hypothetical protein